jgi:hypothetical protein
MPATSNIDRKTAAVPPQSAREPLTPPTAPPRIAVKILSFKPFSKNTLVGFFDLEIFDCLLIHGCSLHQKDSDKWVGWPSREYKNQDGSKTWAPICEASGKGSRAALQHGILEALSAYMESAPKPKAAADTEEPW